MENNQELFDLYSKMLKDYHHDLFYAKDSKTKNFCKDLINNNNVQICKYPNLYSGVADSLRKEIYNNKANGENYYFTAEALYSLQVEHFSQLLVSLSKQQENVVDDKQLYDEFGSEITKMCSSLNDEQAQDVKNNLNEKVEKFEDNDENETCASINSALKFLNDITANNNQESEQEQ